MASDDVKRASLLRRRWEPDRRITVLEEAFNELQARGERLEGSAH